MVLLSIACILTGALLGLRFRVLVLVPATVICIFLVLLVPSSGAGSAWTVIIAVIAGALLQVGYLGGVAMNFFRRRNGLAESNHVSPSIEFGTVSYSIREGNVFGP